MSREYSPFSQNHDPAFRKALNEAYQAGRDSVHEEIKQWRADNPLPNLNWSAEEMEVLKRRKATEGRYLQPDAEDLRTAKLQDVRRGLDELQAFIGNLTDDDTSYEKRCRMLDTISDCLKLA